MARRKKQIAPIAYEPNTTAVENLPLPFVYYPGFYGSFFGFAKDADSEIYLCSCAYPAIENFFKFKQSESPSSSSSLRNFLIDSSEFPHKLGEDIHSKYPNADQGIISRLNFKDKICHECCVSVPSYEYCDPMYGGQFKRNYGWYIRKQSYEFGVGPLQDKFLDNCPEEILDIAQHYPASIDINTAGITDVMAYQKEYGKQRRKIVKFIENAVRDKLGHKKVGEAWVNETNIYLIAKKLYPNYTILRHYRPDFLSRLEMDVYIEELKIGIEYQGIQHYKPIKHWGGAEALQKVKNRDKLKAKLCKENSISLIYVHYDEVVSEKLIKEKIEQALMQDVFEVALTS